MGWCERVVTYETAVGSSGYHVAVFRLCVVGATFLSVAYLLFRLRPRSRSSFSWTSSPSSTSASSLSTSKSSSASSSAKSWWGRLGGGKGGEGGAEGEGVPVPVYFSFLLFACGTFLVVLVVYLLPDGSGAWGRVLQVAQILAIAAQWFIQTAVVFFMYERDTEGPAVRTTVLRAGVFSGTLGGGVVLAYFAGCRYCGQLAAEVSLLCLFTVTIALPLSPWAKYAARPAAVWWSIFQAAVHTLFAINYIFDLAKLDEVAACFDIAADGSYYLLYAFLLYATVLADSSYWRKKGALLLNTDELGQRLDMPGVLQEDAEEGRVALKILRSQSLELHELLGTGAMADVYRATWRGTHVAVKKFKVSRKSAEELRESLLQEGRLLSELRHPNVLLLLGVTIEPDFMSIVTEIQFMSRGSLFDLVHPSLNAEALAGPSTQKGSEILQRPALFLRILRDVARGMLFLHSSNVSNPTSIGSTNATKWMAPEVLRGERYSDTADVYSFGAVVWEMTTGRVPHAGIAPFRLIAMLVSQDLQLPLPQNCAPRLRELMRRCMHRVPNERPTFADILRETEAMDEDDVAVDLSADAGIEAQIQAALLASQPQQVSHEAHRTVN